MTRKQLYAWLVHAYTASGGVVGMFALFAAASGQTREAFLLLAVTMLIDGTDGILARRVQVSKVLPQFDGSMVDNVIDVFTYVWIPVFIMWQEQVLPHPLFLAVPILAAMYAYGQVNMKSDDAFFIGFPSYWNIVALYLFWLRPVPLVAILLVVVPGILSFVPTRYLYPSKNPLFSKTNWALSLAWALLILWLLLQPQPDQATVLISLLYPAFYFFSSLYVDWRIRNGRPFRSRA
jgi:phosphatidylcholine synthase